MPPVGPRLADDRAVPADEHRRAAAPGTGDAGDVARMVCDQFARQPHRIRPPLIRVLPFAFGAAVFGVAVFSIAHRALADQATARREQCDLQPRRTEVVGQQQLPVLRARHAKGQQEHRDVVGP